MITIPIIVIISIIMVLHQQQQQVILVDLSSEEMKGDAGMEGGRGRERKKERGKRGEEETGTRNMCILRGNVV